MLDIGWSELLLVAVVAIVVIGPKDLPDALRTVGRTLTKLRRMAGEFQGQFNAALREANLEDVKKEFDAIRDQTSVLKGGLNPVDIARNEIRGAIPAPTATPTPATTVDATLTSSSPVEAAPAVAAPAAVLKGKTVGVQGSTVNSQFLETYLKDTIEIREYKTTEQHDLDLTAGRIDAIFAGHGALKATQEKPEFKDMVIAGTGMRGGLLGRGVAVGMRKDDAELKKGFDEAIQAAIKDGTIKKLSEKWFKIDATPQV